MAAGYYQIILIPSMNWAELTEDGIEFFGSSTIQFKLLVKYLESLNDLFNSSPPDKWPSFDKECYFSFDDGTNKFDLELNTGQKEINISEVSVRTSLYKPNGNILKTLEICKDICNQFNLKPWDMKIRRIIDLNNKSDIAEVVNKFNSFPM
ncbi:hypothetical protein ACFO9Q_10975 [Paenibacillus sp. GCM10023252]|uniref:hypothetical protein n=1 Tax=Paenibacillus sp. GCM10023252 TaxID=3252649 RepID=UPI0036111022